MAKKKVVQVSKGRKKTSKISASPKKEPVSTRLRRGEPQTMEELLAEYGGSMRGLSQGDKVVGKVIGKENDRLVLDIGGKSEGLVAEKAYKEAESYIKTLNLGDEVEASVIIPETPDGFTILSLRESAQAATWNRLFKAKDEGTVLLAEAQGLNPSGVLVGVSGLGGFIPNSQLGKDASKNKNSLLGKSLKVIAIEVDRKANKVILSERAVSEAQDMALAQEALTRIKEGEVFDGEVSSIYDFGCFVKIQAPVGKKKVPLEGLVHISEMSWEKVGDPRTMFEEGDKVKVKVIGKKDSRLALSIKQTLADPWEDVEKKYKAETKVKGKVVKISDFGAFIALEPGIEGLVHITKIPPGMKLEEGSEVKVYIEEVDAKARKISLGLVLTAKPVGYK